MNPFKTLRVNNSPLLFAACVLVSFGLTNFYFSGADTAQIINVIAHIMLVPVYLFNEILIKLELNSLTLNPVVVFLVLLFTYSFLVLSLNKILSWRKT